MKDGTYHRDLGPLPGAHLWAGDLDLAYSLHAAQECVRDRYVKIPMFPAVVFEAEDVVEVEVRRGEPVKAVLRVPLNDRDDVIYVLQRPVEGKAFVRTVWCNRAEDSHRTLDASKYVSLLDNK